MEMNKRGQLFTVFAIVILGLMFLVAEVSTDVHERTTIKSRISTMNSYIDSFEKNLERQVYIVGYRTIFLAGVDIASTGEYINVSEFFSEAFFNGTIRGTPHDFLSGVTYSNITDAINEKSEKMNLNVSLTNPEIEVYQEDPWNIKVKLSTDLVMEDIGGLAKWDKRQEVVATIQISQFEDPLYTIESFSKISRKINQSPYEGNFTSGNLNDHILSGYYISSPLAPSFLNRMEGNFSADENGIESFVILPELSSQGLQTKTKSHVDFIYFSTDNPTYYTVGGTPSWFRIDNSSGRMNYYDIS
jgi:hypothetical protein